VAAVEDLEFGPRNSCLQPLGAIHRHGWVASSVHDERRDVDA
jgi:hypothetical protein